MDLLVIADDLTGALDTGVQFSELGICAYMAVNIDYLDDFQDVGHEVLIVDTNSRHLKPEEAMTKINKAINFAKNNGARIIYKKTDSTLRGNIGIELDALMKGYNGQPILFIPSYPKMGRTTKNGIHYVNGVELTKTDFANDKLNPIDSGNLYEILSKKTNMNIEIVTESSRDRLEQFNQNTIYVFDAETEKDMESIKNLVRKIGGAQLFAGCAGFAHYLPELIGIEGKANKRSYKLQGKTLVLCGSIHPVSINQINAAKNNGIVSVKTEPQDILDKEKLEALSAKIIKLFEYNETVILITLNSRKELRKYKEYKSNMNIEQMSSIIANNFGSICKSVLNSMDVSNLIVFGGDTLRGVIDKLGVKGLKPKYQIFDGIPLCEINIKKNRINLISKAGGFGDENTLTDILKYLNILN